MVFTKLDKEILISAVVIIILIILGGFIFYKTTGSSQVPIKNVTGGAQVETKTK